MTWKLFLDDIRDPVQDDFVVARSAKAARDIVIANGCPIFITFDHDLDDAAYAGAPEEETGYDFAKWLVEKDMDMGGRFIPADFTFEVHSQNPVGATNIRNYLNQYLDVRR